VAEGALGGADPIRISAGDYEVRIDSAPPVQLPVTVTSEQQVTLQLKRERGKVFHRVRRQSAEYVACDEPPALEEPLPAASGDGWESP
jgi:hypothetical protein